MIKVRLGITFGWEDIGQEMVQRRLPGAGKVCIIFYLVDGYIRYIIHGYMDECLSRNSLRCISQVRVMNFTTCILQVNKENPQN